LARRASKRISGLLLLGAPLSLVVGGRFGHSREQQQPSSASIYLVRDERA